MRFSLRTLLIAPLVVGCAILFARFAILLPDATAAKHRVECQENLRRNWQAISHHLQTHGSLSLMFEQVIDHEETLKLRKQLCLECPAVLNRNTEGAVHYEFNASFNPHTAVIAQNAVPIMWDKPTNHSGGSSEVLIVNVLMSDGSVRVWTGNREEFKKWKSNLAP